MDAGQLSHNYAQVLQGIADACERYGRKSDEVVLVAVSKFHSVEDMAVVAQAGQIDFGENYLQEAMEKRALLGDRPFAASLRWHMIGHLQTRKAKKAAGNFSLIHTLDSMNLADALEKSLAAENREQAVLVEVNIANEPQKSGIAINGLPSLLDHVQKNCPHLDLRGLMCLPPFFDSGEGARPYFEKLRRLRDQWAPDTQHGLPELSMGMSGDYAAAIAEGATLVRIGTKIFGPRPPKISGVE